MRAKALNRPLVSVIVPVEPHGDASGCLKALKALDWPRARLEVLLVRGLQPSRQRNLAAARARGAWLLFLDSDSRPEPGLLKELLATAGRLKADAVGGPNLPPLGEALPQRAFSRALASYFGSMASRARYTAVGKERLSGEKELILCNLAMRRKPFLGLGGFREDLYPNEENEFLNRFQAAGHRVAYAPRAFVRRPRRASLAAFCGQAFRYGRGRMRQMRANFFAGDLVHLLPLLGVAYLAALPWSLRASRAFAWPLAAYLAFDLATCFGLAGLRHTAYGLGLWAGLFGAGKPGAAGKISLTKVKP
jgi:succinoglycan biosynthesis protein ExoA